MTWGLWGAAFLGALVFIGRYGSPFPYTDDWAIVPYVTGNAEVDLPYLWQLVNEHRQFLYKLTLINLVKLSGGDFRAGDYFSAVTLGALSSAMIWAARRVRGWTAYTDGFFALVLLSWGVVFYWPTNIAYLLATLLAGVVLVVMVTRAQRLTLGGGVLAGLCVALLPLCSAPGLALGPGLGAWLLVAALLHYRSGLPHAKRDSLITLALLGVALAVAGAYFIGFQRPASYGKSPSWWSTLRCCLQFFTASFGEGVYAVWPLAGAIMAAMLALGLGGLLALLMRGGRAERLRAFALLCFLGAMACLALAVGVGRAAEGGLSGLTYPTSAFPVLCCLYFIGVIYKPRTVGRLAQGALFGMLGIMFVLALRAGRESGREFHRGMAALEEDLNVGEPLYVLLARHRNALAPDDYYDQAWLGDFMGQMHRAGMGPFARLQPNPPFAYFPFPIDKVEAREMTWDGQTGSGSGAGSALVMTLPRPTYLAGLQIRFTHSNPNTATMSFSWANAEADGPPARANYIRHRDLYSQGQDGDMTVYIADTVRRVYIQPDVQDFTIDVSDITLLVPGGQEKKPVVTGPAAASPAGR